ncbi:uncharacterized protein ACIQIH_017359 [Cyanocitta cristata]
MLWVLRHQESGAESRIPWGYREARRDSRVPGAALSPPLLVASAAAPAAHCASLLSPDLAQGQLQLAQLGRDLAADGSPVSPPEGQGRSPVAAVRYRNHGQRRFSMEDVSKRLSLPMDIRLPPEFLQKLQMESPELPKPLIFEYLDNDLKQYLENCGNLMSVHNVKVRGVPGTPCPIPHPGWGCFGAGGAWISSLSCSVCNTLLYRGCPHHKWDMTQKHKLCKLSQITLWNHERS